MRLAVVCPGRGTYTRQELGYLGAIGGRDDPHVRLIDARRAADGLPTVADLDAAAAFSLRTHTPGENAADLIYACSLSDFLRLDRDRHEVVAVTGNSMGWYTALRVAGALDDESASHLVSTMGSMMRDRVIGGQAVYPLVASDWTPSPDRVQSLNRGLEIASQHGRIWHSIRFGGYAVIGGEEEAIKAFVESVPPLDDRYPLRLPNHAAFHTPLMEPVSEAGKRAVSLGAFRAPTIPMIDGCGTIWSPYATDPVALYRYTLETQVMSTYDFTAALEVTIKEFAPDALVLLGPGSSTGGAIGQVLCQLGWRGVANKGSFGDLQASTPFLFAMGRSDQRALL